MEGRTNLLPKVGGYVNGDIKNCVVANGNTIVLGDFVQFYNTDFSTPVPGFKHGEYYCVQFELSQLGHCLQIFWEMATPQLQLTEKWFDGEEFNTEDTFLTLPISGSINGTICNVENDKFLFLEKNSLSATLIEKINDVWTCRELTNVTYNVSDFYFGSPNYLTKVHSGLFGHYRNDGKGVIVTYNNQTETVVVSGNTQNVNFGGNINNGKRADAIYDEANNIFVSSSGYVYSVSGSTFTLISSGGKSFNNAVKIGLNKWLCCKYTNNISNQTFIITTSQEGAVYSDYIVFENLYYSIVGFNGIVVGFASDNTGIYGNSIVYDENTDQFFEGERSKLITLNSTQNIFNYVRCDNRLGYIEYGTLASYGYNNGYMILYEVKENNVYPAEAVTKVIRYLNKVNGIAKTSGTAGDTIQVYVPQISS